MAYYSTTVDADVEIDLNELDEQDLIDHLEARGYIVSHNIIDDDPIFESNELDILSSIVQGASPGTPLYFIYEKLQAMR